MTVGSGAHVQVSNHSQDQCACTSGVLKEYESVHDYVSNTCDNALSEESCDHHGFFLRLDLHQKDSSTRNQSTPQDRLNIPRTTSVKDTLFPVVRNGRVSHQFWHYWNATRVSLNCSKVTQGISVIHTVLNSFLTAAFMTQPDSNGLLRIFVLRISQTPSAVPISRCPNDMIHIVLVFLDRDDVPSV